MILSDEQIIFVENTTNSRSYIDHARAIEAAVLSAVEDKLKDAERYRWLREEHNITLPLGRVSWKMNSDRSKSCWVNIVDGKDLDKAIDAAMKEVK